MQFRSAARVGSVLVAAGGSFRGRPRSVRTTLATSRPMETAMAAK
jgi:hypothetical protein